MFAFQLARHQVDVVVQHVAAETELVERVHP
jgi:hypothetical protein